MSEPEKPAVRVRRWWLFLPLLAIVAAPVGLAIYDWARAVRTARNDTAVLAWTKATGGFLGREWTQPVTPGVSMTASETPPLTGAYAGYAYATRVEAVYEWQPIFHPIIGGPYLIRSRATAAIVRNDSGQWMPVMVE